MKFKRTLASSLIGIVACLLVGCANDQKKTNSTPTHHLNKSRVVSSSSMRTPSKHDKARKSAAASNSKDTKKDRVAENMDEFTNVQITQATYPSLMQGNWYYYDQYSKKIQVIFFDNNIDGSYEHGRRKVGDFLHKYIKHDPEKESKAYQKRTSNWDFISAKVRIKGRYYLNIMGWNQGAGDGISYNVSRINGNQVLTTAEGAGFWVVYHAYRTPELAQQYKQKRYSGFVYQRN
ncbi:hypothetical protein PT285_00875 [Lactobacillus sp. ESL0791]|uniref:hypothetical protein n=1 Tax=Lactobacillus sp. ESL0791 TaxID=2983234 RepID=UPI0023F991E1|nr:hypothetical protein [Lactobacillus sp. ESL0791]MDF7637991.1 hypothetical protein [Lactobacillus sp. ESL0791]